MKKKITGIITTIIFDDGDCTMGSFGIDDEFMVDLQNWFKGYNRN